MSRRYNSWFDVAALDEHLTVFLKLDEALERFLGDSASFSREPYKISTDSGSVERSSRAQISDAVDSLGGSLNALEVWYAGPGCCHVSLDVRPFAAHPLYRIGCMLRVSGDDEQENNGRFDTLRNRMDAEIKRQWPKPKAEEQVTAPPAVSPPPATAPSAPLSRAATAPKDRGIKQWWDGVSRHPLWATIIGGVVVAGIIALVRLGLVTR
jgi:hypothetical protein